MQTLNLLCLDAALSNSGYAVITLKRENGNAKLSLPAYGVIRTSPSDSTKDRVGFILPQVNYVIETHKIDCVIIELTHEATFEKKGSSFFAARAAGAMKLFASCFGIIGYMYAKNIPVETIGPRTWQDSQAIATYGKAKDASKKWSMDSAHRILSAMGISRRIANDQHHAADAINLGVYYCNNMIHLIKPECWKEVV